MRPSSTYLLLASTALLFAACHGSADNAGDTPATGPAPLSTAVASVTVNPSSARIAVGETVQLLGQPRSLSGAVTGATGILWSTSAPTIASVTQNGLVTALSNGSAIITMSADGHSGQSVITVGPAAAGGR